MPCREPSDNKTGYAPGPGFALTLQGLRPNQGHSPNYILVALPAGLSPASHQAAKPER
jgi:hypothetical protein